MSRENRGQDKSKKYISSEMRKILQSVEDSKI